MKEAAVQDVFVSWLESQGWQVHSSARRTDIVARRGGVELRAEVKGTTKDSGTDADTAYGQLLRCMDRSVDVQYALVGPTSAFKALRRVPDFVRRRLGIALYEVTAEGTVIEHDLPRLPPPTAPSRAAFDPGAFGVLVRPEPTTLDLNETEFVYRWSARLIPPGDNESWSDLNDLDQSRSVARIKWEHVAFGAAINAGRDPFLVADECSGLLVDIYDLLHDENGDARPDFLEGASLGSDLLHIQRVDVASEYEFTAVAPWLFEYVLERFSGGCGFAAYYSDKVPHIALRSVLHDRGFKFYKTAPVYIADLSHQRPSLLGGRERS